MTDTALTGIPVHHPLGDEHPYSRGHTERMPRYPLAGQPVTIGIQSAPGNGHVHVNWTIDGIPQSAIPATRLSAGEDLWEVVIPPQVDGAKVNYRIVAGETARSSTFEYEVVGWKTDAEATIAWRETSAGVWEGVIRAFQPHPPSPSPPRP